MGYKCPPNPRFHRLCDNNKGFAFRQMNHVNQAAVMIDTHTPTSFYDIGYLLSRYSWHDTNFAYYTHSQTCLKENVKRFKSLIIFCLEYDGTRVLGWYHYFRKMYAVHGNQQRISNSINTKVDMFTFFEKKIREVLN